MRIATWNVNSLKMRLPRIEEFLGYAGQMERALVRLEQASNELREVALGGNAVGTGINMHPDFPRRTIELINERTGLVLEIKLANRTFSQHNFRVAQKIRGAFKHFQVQAFGIDLKHARNG